MSTQPDLTQPEFLSTKLPGAVRRLWGLSSLSRQRHLLCRFGSVALSLRKTPTRRDSRRGKAQAWAGGWRSLCWEVAALTTALAARPACSPSSPEPTSWTRSRGSTTSLARLLGRPSPSSNGKCSPPGRPTTADSPCLCRPQGPPHNPASPAVGFCPWNVHSGHRGL